MLSPRQVHLDFHTSEDIPGIARQFDADQFADTAAEAAVTSVTVFARCHHGWLYYPSQRFPELVHPQLAQKDLLLRQVRSLHKRGIKAPVYVTVQYDYQQARAHPEWLIRNADGSHMGSGFDEPGFYQALCVNTGYAAFLRAQTEEICALLSGELDGVFFDIVGIKPCRCAACRGEMQERGIDTADDGAVRAFAKTVMERFKADMSARVRRCAPDGTVFFNAGHIGPYMDREAAKSYSHFELESLASGGWGYLHFPVTARYARTLGLDCLGMTGKFHTTWGDFHSLKNQAALEFECFRMLSYGFACSIGDQLEPNGRLNPATYRLIGNVYKRFAECEAWARPSVPVVEAAVVTPEDDLCEGRVPRVMLGAEQLLDELCLQFDIIAPDAPFDSYPLLILPDGLTVTERFQERLNAYVSAGGAVLACGGGGLNAAGAYPACFGTGHTGMAETYPDFLIAQGPLAQGLEPDTEYVVYERGEAAQAVDAQPLLYACAPYFNREGNRFCSHLYTPSAHGEGYPVGFEKGRVILLTHPLFSQYRANAPRWVKTIVGNAVNRLLPGRLVRHNGPSTVTVTVLHQPEQRRYAVHILCYVPVRKSETIDSIEERTTLYNLTLALRLPHAPAAARLVPENQPLEILDNAVTVPQVDGYAIVEVPY